MSDSEALVVVEHDAYGIEGAVRLTMNRPHAFNALSEAMLDAMERELERVGESEARVVLIAGEGRAFCAGHDLKEMRAEPALDTYRALFTRCSRMMLTIQRIPQPVIARVHGIATAAGCQLVAMCDLAVASEEARFAVSGVNLGLFCATPSVALSRNVSRKAAFEMLMTGDFIDARTARERGLVNRVAPPGELDDAVRALASSIAGKPREAVAAGKRLFYRQLEAGIDAAYALASETMACNMMNEATLEGTQAFVEKRLPRW
ncbi:MULTISPECIES: enoyl-CoA hydratase [unclassified Caballeronia]|uniref:enoyl-CoA hydratase n=1 Tax=unclassified Caballeronia TaxID=2646786 RepID=UPI002859F45F|nr:MULTISPECIES: enoyl-CoA hydratase [unclassified Caballeronia]MDR5740788.1 enoyl-CoA hydratase [Caballeronia sp. LZ016]MDR5808691.1 enoyl-CoA hydratase [Caballeronia sp. LZ019]